MIQQVRRRLKATHLHHPESRISTGSFPSRRRWLFVSMKSQSSLSACHLRRDHVEIVRRAMRKMKTKVSKAKFKWTKTHAMKIPDSEHKVAAQSQKEIGAVDANT